MGGRGGYSGGGGGSFSAPAMSGSEKQVAWAKSIVEQPYQNAMNLSKTSERIYKEAGIKSEGINAKIYKEAAETYKKEATAAIKRGGNSAKMVIDERMQFARAMNTIINMIAKKHGKLPVNMQHV